MNQMSIGMGQPSRPPPVNRPQGALPPSVPQRPRASPNMGMGGAPQLPARPRPGGAPPLPSRPMGGAVTNANSLI